MLESCTFPYGVSNEIALCVLNLRWHRQLCLLCVYTSQNPSSPSFILSLLAQTHIWKEETQWSVSTWHKTSCIFFLWYLRRPKLIPKSRQTQKIMHSKVFSFLGTCECDLWCPASISNSALQWLMWWKYSSHQSIKWWVGIFVYLSATVIDVVVEYVIIPLTDRPTATDRVDK